MILAVYLSLALVVVLGALYLALQWYIIVTREPDSIRCDAGNPGA